MGKSAVLKPGRRKGPAASVGRMPAPERREQLIQVAVDLFSRKGFNGTTTREIAAAAGVTEAIIFRHFETKEHLYTAIIDKRFKSPDAEEWIAGLRSAMDRDDDEGVIRQLINAIIFTHKTDPEFQRLMLYAALEGNATALLYMREVTTSIVDEFRHYLARRQKKRAIRAISPDAALMAIVGMAKQYSLDTYVHGFQQHCLSDEQAVETFTKVAMEGLCLQGRAPARKR